MRGGRQGVQTLPQTGQKPNQTARAAGYLSAHWQPRKRTTN